MVLKPKGRTNKKEYEYLSMEEYMHKAKEELA